MSILFIYPYPPSFGRYKGLQKKINTLYTHTTKINIHYARTSKSIILQFFEENTPHECIQHMIRTLAPARHFCGYDATKIAVYYVCKTKIG